METKLDLRIYKTYKALHDAFTEILEHKSFEELTINELCDKAMIRRATFYKHFTDKYEYFNFYLSELRESFKEQVSTKTDISDPVAYSTQMLHEMLLFGRKHKKILDRMKYSNRMSFLYQSLLEQISLELRYVFISAQKKKPTPELELIISFYAGGLINAVFWWLNNPTKLDEDAIAEQIVKLVPLPKELLE